MEKEEILNVGRTKYVWEPFYKKKRNKRRFQ